MPDLIEPEHLNNSITGAFFAPANRDHKVEGSLYEGINIGLSTRDTPDQLCKSAEYLLAYRDLEASKLALGRQVHGSSVSFAVKPGIYDNSDGLVANSTDVVLGIQVADCAALLIADPVNRVIGAFHAGWRGAAAGVVREGIKKMNGAGGDPQHMRAYISPCISLENFEVGEEVARQFPNEFCDYVSWDKPHIDLKGFLFSELLEAGVSESNIHTSEYCTMEDTRFYSYRRENKKAGRMLACIYLKSGFNETV